MNALLIPIYEPTSRVLPFLSSFHGDEFDAYLVVDDGSGESYDEIFAHVKEKTPFEVISYRGNKGKGHALKEGLRHLIREYPELDFVVTADGDGQHTYDDILSVCSAAKEHPHRVILGARDFSNAPKKSQSGNVWSARYFHMATLTKVSDCQTGLRALPKSSFDLALHTYGERFDYEMNFLLIAARECGVFEVKIETIYEDNNAGSHFRPVLDSLLIMRTPIAYLLVGIFSFLIDIGIFALLGNFVFTDAATNPITLFFCHTLSRMVSVPFNYFLLDRVVFHHKSIFHHSWWKYIVLAMASMLDCYVLSAALCFFFPNMYLWKTVIDVLFGIAKYFINLLIIFANRKFGRKKVLH